METETAGVRGRGGLAPVVILAGVTLATLSIASLYLMMQSGVRRTGWIRVGVVGDMEHLYLAEAVCANSINRLKKTSWEMRYYAQGKDPNTPQSDVVQGAYGGGEYTLVVSDVVSPTGRPTPNLADLFIQMTYRNSTKNIVSRVRYRTPTIQRPTPYQVLRMAEVPQDVQQPDSRTAVADQFASDAASQADNRPLASVVARAVRSLALSTAGLTAAAAARHALATDFLARTALEKTAVDALTQGDAAYYADGKAGDFEAALLAYEQAKIAALAQRPTAPGDYEENYPRALYGIARARMGLAETIANDPSDDTPANRAARSGQLNMAVAALNEIRATFPTSPIVPYTILQQAKVAYLQSPDSTGRLAALGKLDALATYDGWRLWGEDRPVLSSDGEANSVLNLARFAYTHVLYALARAPAPDNSWNVWAVNLYGEASRKSMQLTILPDCDRESDPAVDDRDLVTTSLDGGKVSFRMLGRACGTTEQKVYTMDLDGSNFREISSKTVGASNQGWEPDWFKSWKADPANLLPGSPACKADREEDLMGAPLLNLISDSLGKASGHLANRIDCPSGTGLPPGLMQKLSKAQKPLLPPFVSHSRSIDPFTFATVARQLQAHFRTLSVRDPPATSLQTSLGLAALPVGEQWTAIGGTVLAGMTAYRDHVLSNLPTDAAAASELADDVKHYFEGAVRIKGSIDLCRADNNVDSLKKAVAACRFLSDPLQCAKKVDADVAALITKTSHGGRGDDKE